MRCVGEAAYVKWVQLTPIAPLVARYLVLLNDCMRQVDQALRCVSNRVWDAL
jgi:hypothetical protein